MKSKLFTTLTLLFLTNITYTQITLPQTYNHGTNSATFSLDLFEKPSGPLILFKGTSGNEIPRLIAIPGANNNTAFIEAANDDDIENAGTIRMGLRGNTAILGTANIGSPSQRIENFAIEIDGKNENTSEFFQIGTNGRFINGTPTILFHVQEDGKIGVGTANPTERLSVNGMVFCEEAKVVNDIEAPDYVFQPEYQLRPLEEVEVYINENSHLPEIPSAAEFAENGIHLGKMSFDLLKKVEELTLYMIQLKKENKELKNRINKLENN